MSLIGYATNEKVVKGFFIVYFAVGVAGFLIPSTYELFTKLIPFSLLLGFGFLAYFHPFYKISGRAITAFLLILLLGLIVEIIGVKTGVVFGEYRYGSSLGLQIFNTPVLIGLNWLFLTYTSASIIDRLNIHVVLKILLASLIMLIYDIVLEQAAPMLDMWYWKNNSIPLQNYVTWFLLALLFHGFLKIFKVKINNPLALVILCSQFGFFLLLVILMR